MSPEAMETLSQLLLDLYTACDTLPFPEFQREALRLVRTRLPFDSALWVAGVQGPQGEPVIFSTHVFNLPEEMLAGYERVKDHDQLAVQALAQIGTTVNLSLSDVAWEEGSEAMRAHAQRYGMQHTLVTMTFGPVTGLISSIAFYRANPEKSYSEQERLLKQNLVPHLIALCNRSRLRYLEEAMYPDRERRHRAAALVDRKGVLYNADPSFVGLLLTEWPDWHGPVLPQPLFDTFATGTKTRVLLSKTVVHASAVHDLLLLHMREIVPADSLSRREWEVATTFGNGLSHKKIAKQLGIAPGTVRNHINAVYEKLNVTNKAELVHILKAAPR